MPRAQYSLASLFIVTTLVAVASAFVRPVAGYFHNLGPIDIGGASAGGMALLAFAMAVTAIGAVKHALGD